jgi:hypothetical protein
MFLLFKQGRAREDEKREGNIRANITIFREINTEIFRNYWVFRLRPLPDFQKEKTPKNTGFRNLDLFPSSDVHIVLCNFSHDHEYDEKDIVHRQFCGSIHPLPHTPSWSSA